MREAAGSAGALLASPAGGDPVLPVGAGGASWDVLAAGEKGQKKEMGKEPDSGRAGLLLGWGGAGWTDPAVRVCMARPTELRNCLSEGEIKPPRKV